MKNEINVNISSRCINAYQYLRNSGVVIIVEYRRMFSHLMPTDEAEIKRFKERIYNCGKGFVTDLDITECLEAICADIMTEEELWQITS